MFTALQSGLYNVFTWPNILIPIFATLIMMITSFLPGIGGLGVATFLMILTLSWDPVSVLLLFGAIVGGATFMGSVTAILFKVPGGAPSAASLLDGFPLGQKGYPRMAIACSATASAVGSLIGVVVLISIIPVIRPILLEVGPFERLVLGIWGLTTIISIPSKYPLRSLAMSLLGFLVAMIGSDPQTGSARWTFGSDALYSGLNNIIILLGLFTISEILSWRPVSDLRSQNFKPADDDTIAKGVLSIFKNFGLTLNSSLIGTLVGIIPGIGGTVASFIAYGRAARKYDPDGTSFGKGDIRGLIAPESAVDAKDGGSLLPVIAFGLAGSEGTVILLAVLNIHGIVPGLPMLTTDLGLTFTLIGSLLFSNLFTSIVGVAVVPALVRLKTIRIDRLALPALLATMWTALELNGDPADINLVLFFGLCGFLLIKAKWPIIPFVLAFILSRYIETNFSLTLNLIKIGRLTIIDRPVSLALLCALIAAAIWGFTRRKKQPVDRHVNGTGLVVSIGLFAVAIGFAAAAFYDPASYSLFARLIASATAVMLAYNLFVDLRHFGIFLQRRPPTAWTAIAPDQLIMKRLVLLPAFTILNYLFGLVFALGVLVFGWLVHGPEVGARKIASSALIAIALSAGFGLYVSRYSSIVLGEPVLFDVTRLLWP